MHSTNQLSRGRTLGKRWPSHPKQQWQRSRQPLGSQHSHPAGVRQEIGQIFDYNAVLFDHKGRRFVTGVPRGDRIPYLYHPTLPACGQVLSAPPQPLNSTATKSSRRRSRSKRSHLLRSRSPRQSRPKSPPHRVRCTVRGPIPIRRSRPDYRSQLYGHRQSASRL